MKPWGHKLTISVYFEGSPEAGDFEAAANAVNATFPEADFVGIRLDDVEDQPTDQVAS